MKIVQKDIIKQIKIESSNQIITCKLGHLYLLRIENDCVVIKSGDFFKTEHLPLF